MELDVRVAIYLTILMIVLIVLAWIGDVIKNKREKNNPTPETDPSCGPDIIQEVMVTEVIEETTIEE